MYPILKNTFNKHYLFYCKNLYLTHFFAIFQLCIHYLRAKFVNIFRLDIIFIDYNNDHPFNINQRSSHQIRLPQVHKKHAVPRDLSIKNIEFPSERTKGSLRLKTYWHSHRHASFSFVKKKTKNIVFTPW